MKISCRFEISFRSKWLIWNPYRFEFHFVSIHVNTGKELTEHQLSRRERRGRGAQPPPSPHHFQEQKCFFHVKLRNIKFLHVNKMWDYSLLIEQDLSAKKQLGFCEFVVLAENWATIVTKNKFVSIVLNCKIFSFFRHNTDYHQ